MDLQLLLVSAMKESELVFLWAVAPVVQEANHLSSKQLLHCANQVWM